jgi:aquaporin Z
MDQGMQRRVVAELIGTFWLVLGGCGAAVFAIITRGAPGSDDLAEKAASWSSGIGLTGVSLAFGLTVVTGAYALGHISGGHFNPAVTLGLVAAKRFNAKDAGPYIIAQIVGGILAILAIWVIVSGNADWERGWGTLASNGYGDDRGLYSLGAVIVAEVVLTFMFLIIILGATHKKAAAGFGGLAIGLALVLIHLISIPISNTSVNPARSIAPALFEGGDALSQLWVFIVAPIVGAVLAGLAYSWLAPDKD